MKKQSGDPMFGDIWKSYYRQWWIQTNARADSMRDLPVKADISFQDTAQSIVDVVEKDMKPLMKRMTGRYYSKLLEDLEKVRKLADEMRREASNLGI